ncbi:MAG: peptide MFS transporter [Candidatus Nanopelagicales bacterium]|nr:peptide MFS transporter [Candidatus Nanopelagicales bacterium]
MTSQPPADAGVTRSTFLGHPRALATLSMTEMWERFSYFGMRALLALYLVAPPDGVTPPGGGLGFSRGEATAIYGTYIALVYMFPLAGGWIADRILGARRSVLIGGIVIASGHFMMAVPTELTFWLGLLSIALGTGLLKPCMSAMVGGLYAPGDDSRRDAGFSLFYMGINIGAFLSPIVCGALANAINWHWGFAAAGVGMTLGVIQYVAGWRHLGNVGSQPDNPASPETRKRVFVGASIGVLCFAIAVVADSLWRGFSMANLVDILAIVIVALPVVYFWRLFRSRDLSDDERSRARAYVFLFLASAMFWMIFDQAGSTLNVFAQDNTDRTILGWQMPAPFLQAVNPLFIILFAPVFARLWSKLGDRAPSTPVKFSLALFGIGGSFLIMIIPGTNADNGIPSAVWWLILVFLIQTWSELLLSPVGLSATTRLAPRGMESQLLALWFLSFAVGDTLGGQIANELEDLPFGSYYAVFGGAAVVFGVVLFALSPVVRKLMRGTR